MNDVKKIVKLQLNINSSDYDELLDIFIEQACQQIIAYLNKDFTRCEIITNFGYAVSLVVCNLYRNNKISTSMKGIKAMTQGQRSVTYADVSAVISDDVKAMLPTPYVEVL